jgi:hypothetical protein
MSRTRFRTSAPLLTFWIALALMFASGVSPAGAQAPPPVTKLVTEAPEEEETEVKELPFWHFGATFFAGAGTYKMEDVNEDTSVFTDIVLRPYVPEVKIEETTGGASFGAGVRCIINDRFLVAVDYERLMGSTEFGGLLVGVDIAVPADAILYTVGIDLLPKKGVRFGFAGGVGQYFSRMTRSFRSDRSEVDWPAFDISIEGNALGSHYVSFFEYQLTERTHVSALAGYRRATIDNPTIDGETVYREGDPPDEVDVFPADGEPVGAIDWSGFMGRIGIAWYL